MTRYTVETLKSGQPRPYAAHQFEYRITVEQEPYDKPGTLSPWLILGDVENQIAREEADRKAGRMSGGTPPDELRKLQRDWAKKIVRALCPEGFREKGDDDGIVEDSSMAAFTNTLKSLRLDPSEGTIQVLITREYTG